MFISESAAEFNTLMKAFVKKYKDAYNCFDPEFMDLLKLDEDELFLEFSKFNINLRARLPLKKQHFYTINPEAKGMWPEKE